MQLQDPTVNTSHADKLILSYLWTASLCNVVKQNLSYELLNQNASYQTVCPGATGRNTLCLEFCDSDSGNKKLLRYQQM
jgi:hypothetical protein